MSHAGAAAQLEGQGGGQPDWQTCGRHVCKGQITIASSFLMLSVPVQKQNQTVTSCTTWIQCLTDLVPVSWKLRPEKYATPPQDVGPYRQVQLGGQAAGAAAYANAVPSPDSLMARMCQVRNREQGKEGEPLTDVQINSQSFTFILAGEKPGPSLDLHLLRSLGQVQTCI